MPSDTMEPNIPLWMDDAPIVTAQNHNAVLTLWTGLGAILSLLFPCALGTFGILRPGLELSLILLGVLLAASILIYFLGGRKDDRWYTVCTLTNLAGIGLAMRLLLELLGLDLPLEKLALCGLPAAAILFGVVVFYLNGQEGERKGLFVFGIIALLLLCGFAGWRFYQKATGFWLCFGVCGLLGCGCLGAFLWTDRALAERSVSKALAVVSFSVYLLLAVGACLAALFLLSGSGSSSSSREKKSSSGKGGLLGGLFGGTSGSTASSRGSTGVSRSARSLRRGFRIPTYLWYYTPVTRYASIDRMEGVTEEEREEERRRYRRQRWVLLFVVALVVLGLIAFALSAGLR